MHHPRSLLPAAALAAGIALAGCESGSTTPARYTSAQAVVAALKSGGLPCTGGEYLTPVVKGATSETSCSFSTSNSELIDVFPRTHTISKAQVLASSVSTGTQKIWTVYGPNWWVQTSSGYVHRVQHILGGTIVGGPWHPGGSSPPATSPSPTPPATSPSPTPTVSRSPAETLTACGKKMIRWWKSQARGGAGGIGKGITVGSNMNSILNALSGAENAPTDSLAVFEVGVAGLGAADAETAPPIPACADPAGHYGAFLTAVQQVNSDARTDQCVSGCAAGLVLNNEVSPDYRELYAEANRLVPGSPLPAVPSGL